MVYQKKNKEITTCTHQNQQNWANKKRIRDQSFVHFANLPTTINFERKSKH